MKKSVILFMFISALVLGVVNTQAAPIRDMPDRNKDSGDGLGLADSAPTGEEFDIVDQLGRIDIDEEYFFDFFQEDYDEDHGELGLRFPGYYVDLYSTGGDGIPHSIPGFDRGITFDQRADFDQGSGFDKRAKLDQGGKFDKRAGFDSLRGFDREGLLRIRQARQRTPLQEGSDAIFFEEEQEMPFAGDQTRGRDEVGLGKRDNRKELFIPEKPSEKALLQGEDLTLDSVRHVERGFLIKIAMFAVALLALLAGTLKGLIPFKFYFFLTILIVILWNPMESLFISIIIGISALLAPIFG